MNCKKWKLDVCYSSDGKKLLSYEGKINKKLVKGFIENPERYGCLEGSIQEPLKSKILSINMRNIIKSSEV